MTVEQYNNLKIGDEFTLASGIIYKIITKTSEGVNVVTKTGEKLFFNPPYILRSGTLVKTDSLKDQYFQDGNVLVARNHHTYVVCGDKLLGLHGFMNASEYNNDITYSHDDNFDIIQVYKITGWGIGLKDALNLKLSAINSDLLWTRPEITTMSISDIEKKLNLQEGTLRIKK